MLVQYVVLLASRWKSRFFTSEFLAMIIGVHRFPLIMVGPRKKRDLPVTMYRILLYLSRSRGSGSDARRLVRIERATGIDRKDLRELLENLTTAELIDRIDEDGRGRGGHPLVHWNITEAGKVWRSDLGRFIQLGQKMELYPEEFFYLPSDEI